MLYTPLIKCIQTLYNTLQNSRHWLGLVNLFKDNDDEKTHSPWTKQPTDSSCAFAKATKHATKAWKHQEACLIIKVFSKFSFFYLVKTWLSYDELLLLTINS